MRAHGYRLLALLGALLCMTPSFGEVTRPLEPIQVLYGGAPIETATPSLWDGREVFVPLDVARALKCTVTILDREDSAVIGRAGGPRKEIALTRLRRVLMIPLSSLVAVVGMRFTVSGGKCELLPMAEPAAKPKPAQEAQPPVPAVAQPPPGKASPGPSGERPARESAKKPSTLQTPEKVDPADTTTPGPSAHGVVPPVEGAPATVASPIVLSTTRGPSRIREIVCEAVDPAQTRLRILADGPLKPTVRMSGDMSELTVDLPSTVVEAPIPEWTFANPLVTRARAFPIGAPGVTRVVFTLTRLVTYRDRVQPPDGMEIVLRLPKLTGRRFEEMRVVLDPGHGGPSATGCSAMHNGVRIYEKDITLKIARLVHERLSKAGLDVSMTRTTDVAVSLEDRPRQAANKLADVFVSIHVDSAPSNSRASGPTAYFHAADAESRALGQAIVEAVARAGAMPSRGSRSDTSLFSKGLAVLRPAEMPAVLIEVAYITNPGDRAKLVTPEFQAAVAGAIADGIRRYVEGRLPAGAASVPEGVPELQQPEDL